MEQFATSITDEEGYLGFCETAATDDEAFANFRRHPQCLRVVEGLTPDDGAEYFNYVVSGRGEWIERIEEFRHSDSVGNPPAWRYDPIGRFSAATLRYIKVARDIDMLFGSLDGKRIAEIGGGYGGQCRILSVISRFADYAIFDLPGPLKLTRRFLDALAVERARMLDLDAFAGNEDFDLVISNYALSEIRREVQDIYLEKVVRRARHGYMLYNQAHFEAERGAYSYSAEEVAAMIPGARIRDSRELPEADRRIGNVLIVW